MLESPFRKYLKKGGRSPSAVERCIRLVHEFESFLHEGPHPRQLDQAQPEDLEGFVESVESDPKASAKTHLWALTYYFDFSGQKSLAGQARRMRQARIKGTPFLLKDFRGVDLDCVERLARVGIRDVVHMLEAGCTPVQRASLARRSGVQQDVVEELVKLSDLARIGGIKGIRARLYHDAGVDTLEKLAGWDPEEMWGMLVAFVARTGFEGIPPTPKEARSAVTNARKLPKLVEWD